MTKRKIEYWVIPPEQDAEFVACMEEVLEAYAEAYDPKRPVLCMDDVHPTQVHVWKKQLLTGAASLFETRDHAQETAAHKAREAELFEQIGRLNMELDWLTKKFPLSAKARRALIDPRHKTLSIRRQCDLLDLPRSTFYYLPATESKENLRLMRLLDKQYLKTQF